MYSSPMIVHANHFRFAAGEVIGPRLVGSRMVFWVLSGSGRLDVDGTRLDIVTGQAVALPWNHSIRYTASRTDPFHVGGVHLVPHLDGETPIEWRAAHGATDPLRFAGSRADVDWPGADSPRILSRAASEEVRDLGEIAIRRYLEKPNSSVMRALAISLVAAVVTPRAEDARLLPSGVRAAQEYCVAHLDTPISTERLARIAGLSASGLVRQFKVHSGAAPQRWLREQRLNAAARLLTTSTLRVNEIAKSVGFEDPLYFSRAFAARFGVSPREYSRSRPQL